VRAGLGLEAAALDEQVSRQPGHLADSLAHRAIPRPQQATEASSQG
jgi:hypothetical protein